MTASSNDGSSGSGSKLPSLSESVIRKSIERIDPDLKMHVYLSGLSMSLEHTIKIISMVSILHNDRLVKNSPNFTDDDRLNIDATNNILAAAMSKVSSKKNVTGSVN